jgi:Ca-activated chloride channel family protein
MSAETYYTTLGLSPDASHEDIQDAFALLIGKYTNHTSASSNPEYEKLLHAYEVLSDHERRIIYDSLMEDAVPSALMVSVQTSRKKVPLSDAAQLLYLLIEITPPTHIVRSRRPLNLCLVLDRSTSMQGTRLDCLKTAVELVIDKLSPDDLISIISFSDRAEIVSAPSHVNNKHLIVAHVRSIQASGGTEIYQGLSTGVEQLRQAPLDKYNNHLILLTDGHTYGDAEQCIEVAQEASLRGISISTFGIGDEWNDAFLDLLVSSSGGQSAFIEHAAEIVDHLQSRIQGLGIIHGRNLRLKKAFPEAITLQYGFKLLPFAQPVDLSGREIKLGNIEGKGSLSFLLELLLQPQTHERRITIPLEFTVDIPSQQDKEQAIHESVQLVIAAHAPDGETPKDIVKAVRMLNMYRMNEKVWEDLEAGHVDVAATRLRHLTTRLLEAGEIKLAQQANMETERLSNMGNLSAEGRKRLKYGTRALIGQTMKIETDDPL